MHGAYLDSGLPLAKKGHHHHHQRNTVNKHKTQITNLVAPRERVGTYTKLGSMQGNQQNRQVQEKGFSDPLLNMITTMYTVSDSVQTSGKQTMYGFPKLKGGCQPREPASLNQTMLPKLTAIEHH